ncbi:MAG: chemotaxis protein CheW, partial [Bacteroidetes bacterium]|nr:chemotaxis protein CheW [Bacteroidota bacterium]
MPDEINSIYNSSKTAKVDWDEIKRKLESGNQLLINNSLLPIEQKQKILRDRAKVFAKEPKNNVDTENTIEVIQFSLAYEIYGIETFFIREVFPLKEFTPLPSTPAFLLGITNVRGKILPVIDIKKFFNLPVKGLSDLNKLIVLSNASIEFAVLADL